MGVLGGRPCIACTALPYHFLIKLHTHCSNSAAVSIAFAEQTSLAEALVLTKKCLCWGSCGEEQGEKAGGEGWWRGRPCIAFVPPASPLPYQTHHLLQPPFPTVSTMFTGICSALASLGVLVGYIMHCLRQPNTIMHPTSTAATQSVASIVCTEQPPASIEGILAVLRKDTSWERWPHEGLEGKPCAAFLPPAIKVNDHCSHQPKVSILFHTAAICVHCQVLAICSGTVLLLRYA